MCISDINRIFYINENAILKMTHKIYKLVVYITYIENIEHMCLRFNFYTINIKR